MRALWKIDSCQISSLAKYHRNKQNKLYVCILMSFRILYYFLTVVVWRCVLGIVDKGSYSVSRCRSLRYCRILKRRKQTEETKTVPRRCVSITDNGHYFLLITFKCCCLKTQMCAGQDCIYAHEPLEMYILFSNSRIDSL